MTRTSRSSSSPTAPGGVPSRRREPVVSCPTPRRCGGRGDCEPYHKLTRLIRMADRRERRRRWDYRGQRESDPLLWLQAVYLVEALRDARTLYLRRWLGTPDWRTEVKIPALRLALAAGLRAERRWRTGRW